MYQLISQPTHSHLSMASVVFDSQPPYELLSVAAFYSMYLENATLNLRPAYQRNLCWKEEQKVELIHTIMTRCPMPAFLIYNFEADPMECIDGQNRLDTVQKYIEQTPPTEDNPVKPFAWKIDIIDEKTEEIIKTEYVFYKETPTFKSYTDELNRKNKNKGKEYRFMSAREQHRFKNYTVVAQMIKTHLTFEQRKAIFNKYQNGSSISQCDKLKNQDTPFCKWVVSENIEQRLGDRIAAHLKSKKNNWLFDLLRMLRVFSSKNNDPKYSIVATTNGKKMLHDKDFDDSVPNHLEAFLDSIRPLIELQPNMQISFLLIWAIIWRKSDASRREYMVQPKFMIPFAKASLSNQLLCHSTLNNLVAMNSFIENVPDIVKEFEEAIQKVEPPQGLDPPKRGKKASVCKSMREQVWNTHFTKEVGSAKCVCCGIMDLTQLNFEVGHVIAESKGGQTAPDNLRPICKGCNTMMGTNNMKEWMKVKFPNREFK